MADNNRPVGPNTAARRVLSSKLQNNPIGERIRSLRRQKQLTQTVLAAGTFSPSYLSAVESGRIKPSLSALSILADRLEVPLSTLIGEGGEQVLGGRNTSAEEQERQDIMLAQTEAALEGGRTDEAQRLLADLAGRQVATQFATRLAYLQGWSNLLAGDSEAAEGMLKDALGQAAQSESPELSGKLYNLLGQLYQRRGDSSQGLNAYLKAQQDIGDKRDSAFRLNVLGNTANAYAGLGNNGQALNLYQDALSGTGGVEAAAAASLEQSQDYLKAGNYRLARQAADRARYLYEYAAQERQLGRLTGTYGSMLLDMDRADDAEQQLNRANSLLTQANDRQGQALAQANLARLALARGDEDTARRMSEQAQQLISEGGDPRTVGQVLGAMGMVAERRGDTAAADESFSRSIEMLEQAGAGEVIGKVAFNYGQILLARGDAAKAAQYLQKAYLSAGRR